eukprot:46573-Eustigmatos_ZCMA.PRE.1
MMPHCKGGCHLLLAMGRASCLTCGPGCSPAFRSPFIPLSSATYFPNRHTPDQSCHHILPRELLHDTFLIRAVLPRTDLTHHTVRQDK